MMRLSDTGLAKIAKSEGFSPKLYDDHKGMSIGYGHLCSPTEVIRYKSGITQEQALFLLRQDAHKAELAVSYLTKRELTQDQFDALVDFTYNEGVGALNHLEPLLNSVRPFSEVVAKLEQYNKVRDQAGNLKVSPGLEARRAEEAQAFEGPTES